MSWLPIVYAAVGAAVCVVAVHAAQLLRMIVRRLTAEAQQQERPVPPLVRAYFHGTTRTLLVSGIGFAVLTGADIAGRLTGGFGGAWIAGMLGGVMLMVCSFALLFQALADRHLKLHPAKLRAVQAGAGVVGVANAALCLYLVADRGGVFTFS